MVQNRLVGQRWAHRKFFRWHIYSNIPSMCTPVNQPFLESRNTVSPIGNRAAGYFWSLERLDRFDIIDLANSDRVEPSDASEAEDCCIWHIPAWFDVCWENLSYFRTSADFCRGTIMSAMRITEAVLQNADLSCKLFEHWSPNETH